MVIRIVMTIASTKMTIAATLKIVLERARNRGKKGTLFPRFVKGCYFYSPHDGPKRARWAQKSSWTVEKFRNLSPEKRALRLYIYTLSAQVLHKYTVACKGFSMTRAVAMATMETAAFHGRAHWCPPRISAVTLSAPSDRRMGWVVVKEVVDSRHLIAVKPCIQLGPSLGLHLF